MDLQRVRLINRLTTDPAILARATDLEVIISAAGGAAFATSVATSCMVNNTQMLNAPYTSNVTCIGTGRYVTVRAPVGSTLSLAEVEVYGASSCPPRIASNAEQLPGSQCSAAGYGAICVQQCRPGFVASSGAATAVCRGRDWDKAPLVCEPTCPELAPPAYAEDCAKTMIAESFVNASLGRWVSLDPGNQPIGKAWFANDQTLQVRAEQRVDSLCNGCKLCLWPWR